MVRLCVAQCIEAVLEGTDQRHLEPELAASIGRLVGGKEAESIPLVEVVIVGYEQEVQVKLLHRIRIRVAGP